LICPATNDKIGPFAHTNQKDLHVEQVIYTIICPPSDHHQSAFTVECMEFLLIALASQEDKNAQRMAPGI
jgi:hypothetical protein